MNKPLIAITARSYRSDTDNPYYHENQSYFDYIEQAGGIGVLIPYLNPQDAKEAASRFDGLLISGGPDLDPSLYHEEVNGTLAYNHQNDVSDIALYQAFKQQKKPILGICRGMQLMAVAEGSSLIQDIPTLYHISHNQSEMVPVINREEPSHSVTFFPHTRCHEIYGSQCGVNSFHHQAVQFVPKGFQCSAIDQNEIIEAIESLHEPFLIGVQWHPERMLNDKKQLRLAQLFVEACTQSTLQDPKDH